MIKFNPVLLVPLHAMTGSFGGGSHEYAYFPTLFNGVFIQALQMVDYFFTTHRFSVISRCINALAMR